MFGSKRVYRKVIKDIEAAQKRAAGHELEAFLDKAKAEQTASERDDLLNTAFMALIAAALAFWAYGSVAHAVLFGFVAFAVSAIGNKIVGEMRRQRTIEEANKIIDRTPD